MSIISFSGIKIEFKYTFDEQFIGEYDTDGKKIYAASIYLKTPSTGRTELVHNLNIYNYKSIKGYCRVYDTDTKRPIPFINEAGQHLSIQRLFANSIDIFSSFSGNHLYFDLEYTKANE